ncbi:Uncharacterized protein FKW44_021716, partial [Caligus rogercresseyi]
ARHGGGQRCCAKKVFGCYAGVVLTLLVMQQVQTMNATTRAKVKGYIECLLKFETVLIAQIFLKIFEHTSLLSKYLQTSRMALMIAHRLVVGIEDRLKKCVQDFSGVKEAADRFVEWANGELQKEKNSMPGELGLEVNFHHVSSWTPSSKAFMNALQLDIGTSVIFNAPS